jgi:uroporphyrinogen-III synthase
MPMPASLTHLLGTGALVLLHAGEAARHFAQECDRVGLARAGLVLASLAPRIALAAGSGWAAVASAPRAEERALLALARDMCHESDDRRARAPREP